MKRMTCVGLESGGGVNVRTCRSKLVLWVEGVVISCRRWTEDTSVANDLGGSYNVEAEAAKESGITSFYFNPLCVLHPLCYI